MIASRRDDSALLHAVVATVVLQLLVPSSAYASDVTLVVPVLALRGFPVLFVLQLAIVADVRWGNRPAAVRHLRWLLACAAPPIGFNLIAVMSELAGNYPSSARSLLGFYAAGIILSAVLALAAIKVPPRTTRAEGADE